MPACWRKKLMNFTYRRNELDVHIYLNILNSEFLDQFKDPSHEALNSFILGHVPGRDEL